MSRDRHPDSETEERERPMSNALYHDNRTAPIVHVERKPTRVSARKVATGTYRPRGFEDLGWRFRYRLKRAIFTVFGPPQLMPHNDPLARLARAREERYAGRRARG
jgi:hypothetical protein